MRIALTVGSLFTTYNYICVVDFVVFRLGKLPIDILNMYHGTNTKTDDMHDY